MSGDPSLPVDQPLSVAGGTPAPLTPEQISALIEGVPIPELEKLLESHAGFVTAPDLGPVVGTAPVPLSPEVLEQLAAGEVAAGEVEELLRVPEVTDEGPITGATPVAVTPEELERAAAGETPPKLVERLQEAAPVEGASLPEVPEISDSRPSASGPLGDLLG